MKTSDEWARWHCNTFGMHTNTELQMVTRWGELFASQGFSPADLHKASLAVFAGDTPARREDHLPAIKAQLGSIARTRRHADPGADEYPPCGICGDPAVGWVIVPKLSLFNTRGEMVPGRPWATAGVTCKCPLGRWRYARLVSQDRRPTGLEDYERHNPHWREQLRAHDDAAAREAGLLVEARDLDRALGDIVARSRPPWQGGPAPAAGGPAGGPEEAGQGDCPF
jgi:hypothetical protein